MNIVENLIRYEVAHALPLRQTLAYGRGRNVQRGEGKGHDGAGRGGAQGGGIGLAGAQLLSQCRSTSADFCQVVSGARGYAKVRQLEQAQPLVPAFKS